MTRFEPAAAGPDLYERIRRLYPICRSITGDGVRETLRLIAEEIELEVREIPSGTPVFDWTVPNEWNIRDAYIADARGERVVDFRASNLHVVNYSVPVHGHMSLAQLRPHLFSIPEQPDWIPYRTAYYAETWGFCLSHRQLEQLEDQTYEVHIDSSLAPGHLTFGQSYLAGETADEVLFSSHVCHPSLCNDNLSGISVAVSLAKILRDRPRRYSYRFVFAPGTIGAITWLALHQPQAERVAHGVILACAGDRGPLTYKRSRRGGAAIDRAFAHLLKDRPGAQLQEFSPLGYDERQYCSPGFNLPVGVLSRTPHGCFPEYHTSADDLDLVAPEALADTLSLLLELVDVIEGDATFRNLNPRCEPQLGRRGLYAAMGGHTGQDRRLREAALLWVLNLSDGGHSLLDVAERSGLPFGTVRDAAASLEAAGLLERMRSA